MIAFIGMLLVGILNLYVSSEYTELARASGTISWKRISLERINNGLKNQTDEAILRKLRRLKNFYIFNLILLWSVLAFASYTIYLAANK